MVPMAKLLRLLSFVLPHYYEILPASHPQSKQARGEERGPETLRGARARDLLRVWLRWVGLVCPLNGSLVVSLTS